MTPDILVSPAEDYRAPLWLPGGNLQTIYAAFVPRLPQFTYRRERWTTPDDDFIDLDWIDGIPEKPLLILFHGLEGSSQSHYVSSLMNAVTPHRWNCVVVHFRSCSGELNKLQRAYHAGDSREIDWIIRRFRKSFTHIYTVGVSLGGNALLKWLGENGENAKELVNAAVAISAPMDLRATGDALGKGFNLIYTRQFLKTLKKKTIQKLRYFPDLFDVELIKKSKTLREFDDAVTAPLHGFKNVDDYWSRASSKPHLINITVPTLLISARNDPFLPAENLPSIHEVSKFVSLEFPTEGGHVGFVSGAFPGKLTWLPKRILNYLRTF